MKYRTVLGGICKDPIAYCKLHKASITKKQLKIKDCVKKECHYLSKYEHDYWKIEEDKLK